MCTLAKPIVDGITEDLQGQAVVLRIDLLSDVGRATASEFGVKAVPTTLVFDGQGQLVLRDVGMPNASAIRQAVEQATTRDIEGDPVTGPRDLIIEPDKPRACPGQTGLRIPARHPRSSDK